jgi:tetratricopeptide (TPR) repeat protein
VYDVLQAPQDNPEAQNQALSTLLVNADALLEQVSDIDNPNLAALARIKAAQAIRTELHLRKDVSAEMVETQIQKAKAAYEQALQSAGTPELKALAKFGLGLCAEELGQTAQAGDIYKDILGDKTFEATVIFKQAQERLDSLEDNSQSFTFAAVPAEAPAAEPQATAPAVIQTPVEAAPTPVSGPTETPKTTPEPVTPSADQTPEQAPTEP